MAVCIKQCSVCGRDYEYCHTYQKIPDKFRWQEVACSPECGAEYFRQIAISRGELSVNDETKASQSNKDDEVFDGVKDEEPELDYDLEIDDEEEIDFEEDEEEDDSGDEEDEEN